MADVGKPTLHHLNNSQSQRILWLLEELQISYNLEFYFRDPKTVRAPPELKKAHPLGKSPVLETAEGRTISESSAIAGYLINTYDSEGRFKGDGGETGNDAIRDESLSSFANATVSMIATLGMIFDLVYSQSPWFIKPLTGLITSGVQSGFIKPELKTCLTHLERELGEQDYFLGKNPGRADFMMSWPVDQLEAAKAIDWNEYPKLKAWYERCHAREAWKSSLTKGNGYDLTFGK